MVENANNNTIAIGELLHMSEGLSLILSTSIYFIPRFKHLLCFNKMKGVAPTEVYMQFYVLEHDFMCSIRNFSNSNTI